MKWASTDRFRETTQFCAFKATCPKTVSRMFQLILQALNINKRSKIGLDYKKSEQSTHLQKVPSECTFAFLTCKFSQFLECQRKTPNYFKLDPARKADNKRANFKTKMYNQITIMFCSLRKKFKIIWLLQKVKWFTP